MMGKSELRNKRRRETKEGKRKREREQWRICFKEIRMSHFKNIEPFHLNNPPPTNQKKEREKSFFWTEPRKRKRKTWEGEREGEERNITCCDIISLSIFVFVFFLEQTNKLSFFFLPSSFSISNSFYHSK